MTTRPSGAGRAAIAACIASLSAAGASAGGVAAAAVTGVSVLALCWGVADGPQAETLMARFRELNDFLTSGRSDSAYFAEMNASYWPMMIRELKRSVRAEGLKAVFRKLSKFRIHHLRLLSHKLFGR